MARASSRPTQTRATPAATRCCAEGASVLSVFFSKCIRGTVTNQKHMSRRLTVSPQIPQASHPKHTRFAQIHADTPLFSPTSENPAKQTGITKQTTIQTRNQKTAHKNPKKHRITHNTDRTETTRKKPPNSKKPTEQ